MLPPATRAAMSTSAGRGLMPRYIAAPYQDQKRGDLVDLTRIAKMSTFEQGGR
jgi:hypothetical protein